MEKLGICSDHAGFELKEYLKCYLAGLGFEIVDFGTYSAESCDYPDFAHQLGSAIDNGDLNRGVAICGSGNGITMTLNKHSKVRAALCWSPEIAALATQHNNANICSLPARFISNEEAVSILDAYFDADFVGAHHQIRIDKIPL